MALDDPRATQRRLVLQNILKVLERAGDSATRTQQAVELAAVQIRALVTGLPEGLLREQAWRRLRPEVTRVMERMALAVGRDLVLEAALMVPEQAAWAASYLSADWEIGGDAPGAAAARRAATGENNPFAPRTVENFPGATFTADDLGRVGASPEMLGVLQSRVPPEVMEQVKRMRIDGATLQQWFGSSVIVGPAGDTIGGVARDQRGVPRFAKFGVDSVDRQVRAGFIAGNTTEEIAQNIIADEIRGSMRLGQGAVRLKADARAAARTGLSNLAEQVHQAQWKAMDAAIDREYRVVDDDGNVFYPGRGLGIQAWRWDASNDSRSCPSCSALDGRTVGRDRSELPQIPLHPNCRCQVLPLSATSLAMEKQEALRLKAGGKPEPRYAVELTTQPPPKQRPKEPRAAYLRRMGDEGWFITKGRAPSGERYWRRRVELTRVQPNGDGRVSDFLATLVDRGVARKDVSGARATLQEYFGGGPGGAKRALVFSRRVRQGTDPQEAMLDLFRRTGEASQRKLVPVAELADRFPEFAEAMENVRRVYSPRQAKLRAQGRPVGKPRRGY